jgi:hypothetical protein
MRGSMARGPGVDPNAFIKRMAMSVNQRVKKLAVDPESGERPSAMHPLVATRAGRRGPGGAGLFRYVYDGPPGVPIKGVSVPEPENDDDIPYADDEPTSEPEPTPEPAKAKLPPNVLPKANQNGDWTEETMAGLTDLGYGPDNEIWPEIAKANGSVAVSDVMNKNGVPSIYRPRMVRIAKYMFAQMGKDYDTGGVVAPAPAQANAGDRVYAKGWQGKPKAKPEPEPEPEMELDSGDLEDDEGEFLDPEEPAVEPSTTQQAGAQNFVKPEPPKTATPATKTARASTIAGLMKQFGKKR